MPDNLTPLAIFCSFADEDEPPFRELEKHLSVLTQQGLISLQIRLGGEPIQVVNQRMEKAAIILLLVSNGESVGTDYATKVIIRHGEESTETAQGVDEIVITLLKFIEDHKVTQTEANNIADDTKGIL
jgi:hypothetical protein